MAKRSEDDYELYLYTIDVYIRLVGALPLDKSLAQFGVQNFSEIGNLDIDDRDFAAVAMRLMLQRKYFVRGKDLFFKGLLKSAEQDFDSGKEDNRPPIGRPGIAQRPRYRVRFREMGTL